MKTDSETENLILEIVDRFLTTWKPTVASAMRTKIWGKSAVLEELAKDGVLLRMDHGGEPRYFPRLLAFELLGDSRRFSFALRSADRWLQQLRDAAIERDSLNVELSKFRKTPEWPADADSSMLHLVTDFSQLVESTSSLDWLAAEESTSKVKKKTPKVKLHPAIREFSDIAKAWSDELSRRGLNPIEKVSHGPLSIAEADRRASKRSGALTEPKTPPSRILATPKFAFLHSSAIRVIVERDYNELVQIRDSALKARFILAGGIIEASLLDALLQDVPRAMTSSPGRRERRPLEEWGLASLLDAAVELKLISSSAQSFGHSVREYRNLVHPGLEYRSGLTLASEEVEISERVMDIVIRDLSS